MSTRFDHEVIEKKWQAKWKEQGLYTAGKRDEAKEKRFVLTEFPYPSGNLHIGHWYAFAVPDIYVRTLRMQGYDVLYPIGFDSFGLPAENAAIKRKLDPKQWTYDNIAYMQKQLESMGNSFDWSRMVITSNPEYYRWTQWIFLQFFKNDLAYRGVGTVNWCPTCNTVLANEQVVDGKCERCGSIVVQREMPEWTMRITKYADRLIDDLEPLAWPEHIKDLQRNWIGRSEGAEITFKLSTGDDLKVFTTRPDTLYGATFVVIAPEHTLVEKLKPAIANWDAVVEYQKITALKNDIERQSEGKEKTGVKLEGVTATNPANGETIPVFIADYVLARYGTGALMAVPAHDERDFAFAKKFNSKIIEVIKPPVLDFLPLVQTGNQFAVDGFNQANILFVGQGEIINSGEFDGMTSEEAGPKIISKVGGKMTSTYRVRDWSISRQRYWGVPIPIVYNPEGKAHAVPDEHLPWTLPTDVDVTPTGEPPLAKSKELKERTEKIFGVGWTPEVETMDTFVDSSWYYMRYADPKNETAFSSHEAQKAWMPVDLYFGGTEHTTLHLLYSRFVQKALFDMGHTPISEPYNLRINRGLVLGPDGNKMSKSKGNVIDPDEQVTRMGADTVKMYLAFMGPYAQPSNYPWDLGGIVGLRRFLERVYDLSEKVNETENTATTQLLHYTIEKITSDIKSFKFNTAISALMIFLNSAEKTGLTKTDYEIFLKLLAPFAPHLSEELWEQANHTTSIHTEAWPSADKNLLVTSSLTIAVQFNGKSRETIIISPGQTEAEVLAIAYTHEGIAKRLERQDIIKVIYVQNKILNLITKDTQN